LWANGNSRPDLGLFPFSEGPVVCPAIDFVPLVACLALRSILTRVRLTLVDADRVQPGHLPGTLDNYTLAFSVEPHGVGRDAQDEQAEHGQYRTSAPTGQK
jgi:hypothetical protein